MFSIARYAWTCIFLIYLIQLYILALFHLIIAAHHLCNENKFLFKHDENLMKQMKLLTLVCNSIPFKLVLKLIEIEDNLKECSEANFIINLVQNFISRKLFAN